MIIAGAQTPSTTVGDDLENLRAGFVSTRQFDVYGVCPIGLRGQTFAPAETGPAYRRPVVFRQLPTGVEFGVADGFSRGLESLGRSAAEARTIEPVLPPTIFRR